MEIDNLVQKANTLGGTVLWINGLHVNACWNQKTLEMYLNPTAPENYLRWCLQRVILEAQKYRGGISTPSSELLLMAEDV